MTTYAKKGDEVVVTIKGRVSYVSNDGRGTFEVGKPANNFYPAMIDPGHPSVTIEVITPPIKVGDVIPPDVTPTDLPEGTVLLTDNGIPWRLHEGAWRTHFHTGVKPSEFWAPYFRSSLLTVVYLP